MSPFKPFHCRPQNYFNKYKLYCCVMENITVVFDFNSFDVFCFSKLMIVIHPVKTKLVNAQFDQIKSIN